MLKNAGYKILHNGKGSILKRLIDIWGKLASAGTTGEINRPIRLGSLQQEDYSCSTG